MTAEQKADLIIAMVGGQVLALAREYRRKMEHPDAQAVGAHGREGGSPSRKSQPGSVCSRSVCSADFGPPAGALSGGSIPETTERGG